MNVVRCAIRDELVSEEVSYYFTYLVVITCG